MAFQISNGRRVMLSHNQSKKKKKNGAKARQVMNFIEQYTMLPTLRMLTSLAFYTPAIRCVIILTPQCFAPEEESSTYK